MTLVLTNEDVEALLTPRACIEPLEQTYREFALGQAANRARTHTYFPVESRAHPRFHYRFKSQEGGSVSAGVWALRIASDMAGVVDLPGGVQRRKLLPVAPGDKYCGLILLFSLESIAPIAIVHDSVMQKMRVAATTAIGIRELSRPDSRVLALFGSGWQAGAHLDTVLAVRPSLERIRVFSPTPEHRRRFAAEMSRQYEIDVVAVESPAEAVRGADVVLAATAAMTPVFDGRLVEPGQHVSTIVATDKDAQRRELDDATVERADLVVVLSRESVEYDDQPQIMSPVRKGTLAWEQVYELGEVLLGQAPTRTSAEQVTLFDNNVGMGLQFAACGAKLLELAQARGAGQEIPTDLFLETTHP
jgi:ornithine cyclodeaminase/alanine dehydrogenase-like protein (mu-crystallin family)